MPAPVERKIAIFAHVERHLTDNGVLFDVTVPGQGVQLNLFGRVLMLALNKTEVVNNREDSEDAIMAALQEHFHIVEIQVVGTSLIFKGATPKI